MPALEPVPDVGIRAAHGEAPLRIMETISNVGAGPCARPEIQGTHGEVPLGTMKTFSNVGADPCVCPPMRMFQGAHAGAPLRQNAEARHDR